MRTRGTVGASKSNRWVFRCQADDGSWSVPVGLGDREVFGRHEVVWIRDQLESWFGEEILICAEEVFGTPSDLGPKGFGFLDPLYVL